MYELPRTIPDVKMLLALASEELRSTAQGLIVPDMENGQYGWLVLSRRAMENAADFKSFKAHGVIVRCPLAVQ